MQIIESFIKLGELLPTFPAELKLKAHLHNSWFSLENIEKALRGVEVYLQEENLRQWLEKYQDRLPVKNPKKVAVVMAGNIPLVGFHDFLSVLISGHILLARMSNDDKILLPWFAQKLIEIEPAWRKKLFFVERINEADAIIATGSDTTAQHFEYYFRNKPHIIRKNRVSVAILNGNETREDLENLGEDIFTHFGLGCRNVAKLFVPTNYDFALFFKVMEKFAEVKNHHKYANNYEYNKAIYLLRPVEHLDNGFLLLSQTTELASPVACLYYDFYENIEDLQNKITQWQEKIQCIVSKEAWWQGSYPFGKAQYPNLWDYADGIDTMDFLLNL
ncbi:MAG: acyl-CoA reductase [Raineya sp.]|nr:acyl-CoA reductase [Raineya sp.]